MALIAFVRKALSQKDWDGFIETFGIPAVFIVMPDDVPEEKSEEYLEMADQVTGDARGVLPGGSDVKTVDNGARGQNPFKDHIKYQDEQVILRGTGGKLTMLAESGSGTLAGNAHADTFAAIARAEAAEISEIFRKCIDAEIIERVTPGEDAYAYFSLAANEEMDPAQVVKDIVSLEGAGLEADEKWIEEKTGYPVRRKTQDIKTQEGGERIMNRDGGDYRKLLRSSLAQAMGVRGEVLEPIDELLAGLQGEGMDDAAWLQFVEDAAESLPELFDVEQAAALAAELEAAMGTAALIGVRDGLRRKTQENNS
jgi:phage gp29-like protein